jgi:Homeodomain-like domain
VWRLGNAGRIVGETPRCERPVHNMDGVLCPARQPARGFASALLATIGERPWVGFWLFAAAHASIWTTLPFALYANLPLDIVEALTYGQWQLGYDKLPPLPWWLVEIAHRAVASDIAYYALGQASVLAAFAAVWTFMLRNTAAKRHDRFLMVKCTERQIRKLKTALRWKMPAVQRERIQMVLLRESGMTQPAIAEAMGVSLSTVNRAPTWPMTGRDQGAQAEANRRPPAREHAADRGKSFARALCQGRRSGRDVEHPRSQGGV